MGILDSLKSVFTPNPEKIVAAASSPAPKSISSGPSSHSTTSFGSKPTTKSSGFPTGYVQSGTAKAGIPVQKERTLKDIFGPKTSATTPASSHVSGSFGPSSSTSSSPIKTPGSVTSGGSLGLKQALPGTTIPSDWGFKAPTGTLSRRAYNEGLRRGEKYNEATDDQKAYVRAYYDALDDDNVVKYYTRLESQLGQARGYNADRFNADYRAANDYLEQQLAARARVYGKESNEYRALKQVQEDFQKLGKDGAIKAASQQASNLSSNLDNTINDVFGGVINTADYAASVDRGRSGVEADKSAKKWFDNNLKNASDTQRNFMYAVFDQEGGLKGVKEKYNDFFGESMNAMNASKSFAEDMAGYDNPIDQFFGYIKNNIKSGLVGQWWGGVKQTFTNTEADPDDKTILGDYSITQAVDDSFKAALGDYADSLELQRYGGMGQDYMKQYLGNEEWFKDMQKEASDFQKLLIGNIFLNSYDEATNTFDPEKAKSTWESIQEQSKEIYKLVNGAMSLPSSEANFENALYSDYFGMGGSYAPEFLGGKTWGQILWDGGVTTSAQGPQAAAAWIAGGLASLVLGPEALAASQMIARSSGGLVMALSAYGNSYKEAVDSGHSVKEARWYGAVEAGNEFISDILLSGFGEGVGILTSGAAKKVVENIGSPLGRALIETGIDALGEGVQEYVQEVSEPLIRNLVFGEDNDVLTVENLFKNEDAAYSFFLGMFSSILMSAPAGLGRSVSNNTQAALYGKSLNTQQSTDKLIDTILNSDLQVKDKVLREEYEAAKETAQRMREGSNNRNDLTVGQMAMQFARAGGDMSFLTNPKTVAYTKDQITVEDMTAGAVSMLASMDGDTSLAADIAKMAKGETVSEEVQQKINDDPKAKQVLEQLQGDLDMSADNALTRAAHETTKKGTQSKIADAVQQNNPNKVIYTPAEQYLNDNALTKPAETRRIGAVLNKVLDGIQITREEAKLLNAKKPGIHATLVDFMGLDISEHATTDQVMKALNDKAAEVAKTMDLQQGVRESVHDQYRVVNRERRPGRGKPGLRNVGSARAVSKTGGTNSETVRSNDQGRTAGVVQGGQREARAVGEGAPGGVPAEAGSGRVGAAQFSPLSGPEGVIPSDQLTPELRNIQRRAASLGAGSVVFLRGQDSYCREIRAEDGSVSYEIGIRVDGPFTSDQYIDHEVTAHLWLKALSRPDYEKFCGHVEMVFGEDFQSVYDQVKALYTNRGYLNGLTEDKVDHQIREEMFALARGAQDYSKYNDPDCKVDFSKYKANADALANLYSLEDMAKGNTSNREVKYKIDHGEYNKEYYEAQGLLKEESSPKKAQSSAAKAFKPAQKQETKTAPKTEKRANPFTPTDEARERASKIPNKERKVLHKEVADLRRQLRNDRALAENPEFLDQVRDWFNRANAAVERANAPAVETETAPAVETEATEAEVDATPAGALRSALADARQELAEQTRKLTELQTAETISDEDVAAAVESLQNIQARISDISNRLNQVEESTTKLDESLSTMAETANQNSDRPVDSDAYRAALENSVEAIREEAKTTEPKAPSTFDYDAELKKLQDDRNRRRQSQLRKMEKNPNKSNESLFAQLKKIEDDYTVKKSKLDAKRDRLAGSGSVSEENQQKSDALLSSLRYIMSDYESDVLELMDKGLSEAEARAEYDRLTDEKNRAVTVVRSEIEKLNPGAVIDVDTTDALFGKVADTSYSLDPVDPDKYNVVFNNPDIEESMSGQELGVYMAAAGVGLLTPFNKSVLVGEYYEDPNSFKVQYNLGPDTNINVVFYPERGSVYVDELFPGGFKGDGIGVVYMLNIIKWAKKLGYERIECEAAKTWPEWRTIMNGYYTWPRLGFNQSLEGLLEDYNDWRNGIEIDKESNQRLQADPRDTFGQDVQSVADLMKTQEGRDWWKKNGCWLDHAVFDLADDSDSMQTLNAYLANRNAMGPLSWSPISKYNLDQLEDVPAEITESYLWKQKGAISRRQTELQKVADQATSMREVRAAEAEQRKLRNYDRQIPGLISRLIMQQNIEAGENSAYSADPEVEELMDRTGEYYGDVNEEEVYQNGLSRTDVEEFNSDTIENRLNELMDELMSLDQNKDAARIAEIFSEMERLQSESFNETEETKKAKVEEPAPKPKTKQIIPKAEQTVKAEKPAAEPVKAEPAAEPVKAEPAPTPEKAPAEPVAEAQRPSLRRGAYPVDVKGLSKKNAITKVTQERMQYESWFDQEKAKLDAQFESNALSDAKYAKQLAKLLNKRNTAFQRYDAQLKLLGQMEEETIKEKATVVKDAETKYAPKNGEWWNRIRDAQAIEIRRRRSDRNTYDVRITDRNGNTVVFEEVSPSRLESSLGDRFKSKALAKERLAPAYTSTTENLGEWSRVNNAQVAPKPKTRSDLETAKDNYGRTVPGRMTARMANSTVRDTSGNLLNVYTLSDRWGINNASTAPFAVWSERPATMNLLRGMNGAEAYDQDGKRSGAKIASLLTELSEHKQASEKTKQSLRDQIAVLERKNREYTTHVTRLNPFHPDHVNPDRADVINGNALQECYLDIRSPMVVDAQGRSLSYAYSLAEKLLADPGSKVNQTKANGDPAGEYDGLKITNVKVTDGEQTLGGGNLDLDTIYISFRPNQAKSSYNPAPTDSDLIAYSADPGIEGWDSYEHLYQLGDFSPSDAVVELSRQEQESYNNYADTLDTIDAWRKNGEITEAEHVRMLNEALAAHQKIVNTTEGLSGLLERYVKEYPGDTKVNPYRAEFARNDGLDIPGARLFGDIILENWSADPADVFADGTLERRILDIMRNKDEATAIEALRLLVSEFHQTGVMPEVENERVRNIFNPRMSNVDTEAVMAEARKNIRRYGRLEPGMKPARDVPLPRRTPEGNLRRVFRTAAESKNTPERAVPIITREAMTREGATYQTITDKSAIAAANRDMMTKGFDQVLAEWRAKADGDVESRHAITKYDIAKAEMLYTEAIKVGDYETGMEVLAELAEVGTTAGQTVQAMRMLKTMPASYQLYYMRRVANRLNRQYAKAIDNGRMPSITIDTALARAVLRAQTQEEIDAAMENLIQSLADQVPATIADKWNAWRYLSMLGNPKTHIRNMLGNGIFVPAVFAKDLIAAGLESTFVKKANRQTSVKGLLAGMTTALGMNTSEYGAFAANDYEGIKDELQSGGKYNPSNAIMDKRTIFKWAPLEKLRTTNGNLLEWEDGLFLRMHYITAMTNFLSTQGMSVAELQSTNAGRKIVNAARAYAFNEAQKATYRDASQIASAINQAKRGAGPVGGILLEGILPFTKTPINILKRGIEYSPVGLVKSLTYDLSKMKSGEMTANEVIDHTAAGMTGTGIALLGLYLASLGLLKGGDDDDDKQADFDKLQGYQNYSLNLGDNYNYTIDWMAPGALPLFFGAELFNQLNDKGEGLTAADWINAATVIAEPFTQLSMLSGLNETLKSAKWDDHPLSSVVLSMGSGYVTQAVPTLLAQLSRSMVADRRTTYVDKNSQVPQPIQRWWQTNVLGKTPLNAERTEYIDAWGRKDTKASFLGRLAENMLSPGYLNRIKTTPVDAELQKLADEVGTGVLFTVPERSIEYNNQTHHLTAEQYAAYAKTRGDAAMSLYTDLFNSYEYQYELSADEKASAVGYLKDYANVLGKQAVFPDYDPTTDNWAEKCDGDSTRLVNMAMLKARAHDLGITAGNNGDFYGMIVSQSWMTPVDQAYAIAQQYTTGSADSIYERKGGPKYELTSERKQILAEHFRQVFPAYYIELVQSQQWQTADNETRVDLLSKVRAEANADSKAWLAHILAEQGAPTYDPSK